MAISPITIALTLVGGLLSAGILGWIRHARLIVCVPRLFSHSNLTSRGQLVEITVFNRGFKTEETIELMLNQHLQYEVVGSNSPDISMNKAKLVISRIGPSDEITTLLLVEGGSFSKTDIISCLSKETKGSIVAKLEDVTPTGPQRIGLVSFFIGAPLIIYVMTFFLESFYKTEMPLTETVAEVMANKEGTSIEKKSTIEVQGWMIPNLYKRNSGALYKYFVNQKIRVTMLQPIQKKDVVSVSVIVENLTSLPIRYSMNINAAGSQEKIPFNERHKSDVFLLPQEKSEAYISAVLSKHNQSQNSNTFYIEGFLKDTFGDSLQISRLVAVN